MHSLPAGAVPIVPKNGRSGTSILPILLFGRSSVPTRRLRSMRQMNSRSGTGARDHRGLVLGRERAEVGDRSAPAPVAVEVDLVEVDDQRVAGLGALDVERPGLRVHLGEIELRQQGLVVDREHVVGCVPRAGHHRVARLDAQHRRMRIAVGELDVVARIVFDLRRDGWPALARPRVRPATAPMTGDAGLCGAFAWLPPGYG